MDIPPEFIPYDGVLKCICGELFLNLNETQKHLSPDFEGFYVCGFRYNQIEEQYECLCGKKFKLRYVAWLHTLKERARTCHDNKINWDDFSCKKCNVLIKTYSKHLIHIKSKRHNRIHHNLHCDVCNTTCRSPKEIETHLASQKHLKKVNGNPLHCSTCNITCRGHKELEKHNQTSKHNKNLSKKENGQHSNYY